VEVRLVFEEQDDAGVVQGPRERLGLGAGARRAGLHAGVEQVGVPHHVARPGPQPPLERLDAHEAHQAARLRRRDVELGSFGLGRAPRWRGEGEGARVEESGVGRGGGGGRTAEKAGGDRSPHGGGRRADAGVRRLPSSAAYEEDGLLLGPMCRCPF
jgi:hypothetical protein